MQMSCEDHARVDQAMASKELINLLVVIKIVQVVFIYVTLSGKINHLVLFMKSEIITPPESPSITDHSGTLIFLIGLTILELWAFKCGQYAGLFNLHEQFKTRVNSERVGLPVCYVKS